MPALVALLARLHAALLVLTDPSTPTPSPCGAGMATGVRRPPSTPSCCSPPRSSPSSSSRWATAGGGAGKIGRLFDRVIDSVIDKV